MGEAKVKVEALLLVAVVLASSVAPSSSRCIPRRLLEVSRYGQQPCKEDRIDRTKPGAEDDGDAGPGRERADRGGRGFRCLRCPSGPEPAWFLPGIYPGRTTEKRRS
nr:uncharacterized protein LOC127309572 [Lolium perenne]